MLEPLTALGQLEKDGLVLLDGGRHRTSRRWKGAMARASLGLIESGQRGGDLRLPIIHALIELYGADLPGQRLAALTHAMLPVEAAELSP